MQVFVDSQPLTAANGTLGELIDAAHEAVGESGRLVVEVRLDGELLDAASLDAKMDQPVEAELIELATAEPRALAQETLGQVAAALDGVREQQEQAASLLRSDQPSEALDHARDALEVWQQAQVSVMQSAQLLGLDLDAMVVAEQPAPELISGLAEKLRELREQLSAGDWLGLADTLEYELTEAAEQWTHLIAELQRQIDAQGGPGRVE